MRCAAADLDRILDVLIENALWYGPPEQRIAVGVDAGRIAVADEGPGVAAGEEEAVFNRFHRGSAGRSVRGGTGLGLPIARELASRWDGTVTLGERGVGRGGRHGHAAARRGRRAGDRCRARTVRPRRVRGRVVTGRRRTLAWIGLALAGLVLAAALTTAAAQLSNQSVGLSSEPVTAGDELAPAASPTSTPTPTRTAKPTAHAHAEAAADAHADAAARADRGAHGRRPRRGAAAEAAPAATTPPAAGAAGVAAATTSCGEAFPNLSLRLPAPWRSARDGVGMTFKTPVAITVGVVCALGGVAGAAVAFPSPPKPQPSVAVAAPAVRTETVHHELRVARRGRDDGGSSPVGTAAATSAHHAGVDDSGHHVGIDSDRRGRGSDDRGFDDSGHHGRGDDGGGHGRSGRS